MAGMQVEEIFYACIYREVHSIKELKANLLIGIKILGPEEVVLDLVLWNAYLGSWKGYIRIQVESRSNSPYRVQRPVQIQKITVIYPQSI